MHVITVNRKELLDFSGNLGSWGGGQSSLLVRKKLLSVLEEISLLGSKSDKLLKIGGGSSDISFIVL